MRSRRTGPNRHFNAEMPPGDEELVDRAHTDAEAFGVLYDRYVNDVYRYCFRRLGNQQAAEDATSSTFFNALSGLKTFNPGMRPFRHWLFGIAHNATIDQLRASSRRQETGIDAIQWFPDRNPLPEAVAIARDDAERLHHAVTGLPIEQQNVIDLRLSGLNGAEIATVLNRKQGAIRATQHRAILKLRALLALSAHPTPGEASDE